MLLTLSEQVIMCILIILLNFLFKYRKADGDILPTRLANK
jgi:hypothetical protein